MNVTIDVLDIHQVAGSFDLIKAVSIALVFTMLVYIVSTCMALFERVYLGAPMANNYAHGSLWDPDATSDVTL